MGFQTWFHYNGNMAMQVCLLIGIAINLWLRGGVKELRNKLEKLEKQNIGFETSVWDCINKWWIFGK